MAEAPHYIPNHTENPLVCETIYRRLPLHGLMVRARQRAWAWELVDFLAITCCAIKWKEKTHELSNECDLTQLVR